MSPEALLRFTETATRLSFGSSLLSSSDFQPFKYLVSNTCPTDERRLCPLILTQHDNRCPPRNDSDSSTVRAAFIPKPARPPRSAFPIHYASLCSSLLPPFEETSPLLVRKPSVPWSRLRWFSNVLTPTLSPLSRPRPGQPKWNCASRVSRPARLLGGPPSSPLAPARLRPAPHPRTLSSAPPRSPPPRPCVSGLRGACRRPSPPACTLPRGSECGCRPHLSPVCACAAPLLLLGQVAPQSRGGTPSPPAC